MTRAERNDLIRVLRYDDGLSCQEVAGRVGLTREHVGQIAPGRPGKIDNAAARGAFLRSRKTATAVAGDLGWMDGTRFDSSRVLKTLGITMSRDGRGSAQYRRFVDAETLGLIARSVGVEPWEVGCHDA